MTVTQAFLDKLLKKLKTGDARGIHLNALPGNYARLDLYDLVNVEQSMHLKFLQELLTKHSFSFQITIDPKLTKNKTKEEADLINKIVKRLNFMYYQERDMFQEEGTKTFAFGYPLLVKRDPVNPKKVLKAPILIWYLELEKDSQRNNTWKISRNEDHPVILNESLQTHLETTEKLKIDDIETFLEDGIIDEQELVKLTHGLLEKFSVTIDESEVLKVLPSSNKEGLDKLTGDAPWIRWSGVFGLYKAQKQSIIRDIEQFAEQGIVDEAAIFDSYQKDTVTPVALDPSQEKVLLTLQEKQKIIIQGPPGTGKSQTLTGIITNALLNGATCLVVGEKRTAMEVIYNHLRSMGLGDLSILIEDINANRKPIVERIRNLVEGEPPAKAVFKKLEYDELKQKYEKLRKDANNRLLLVEQPFFGDYNYLEMVAALNMDLHAYADEAFSQEHKNLPFSYDYEEYAHTKEKIDDLQLLYKRSPQHTQIFRKIPDHKYSLEAVPEKVFEGIEDTQHAVEKLKENIQNNIQTYGQDFNALGGFTQAKGAILGLFGGKHKQIKQQKEQCRNDYAKLKLILESEGYAQNLPDIHTTASFAQIIPHLEQVLYHLTPVLQLRAAFLDFYPYAAYLESQTSAIKIICKQSFEQQNYPAWAETFQAFYWRKVIETFSQRFQFDGFTQNVLDELSDVEQKLKALIPKKILFDWEQKRNTLLASRDISKIKQLYNYRKNKQFETRNSLRKIIFSDFDLFVHTFPVVMVSPVVGASILPLKAGLFDIVLMDEASQLRVEDTFTALLRGKTKIISGDKHQMPPSSYFAATPVFLAASEEAEEETEQADFLADSESLLEFASDSDYNFTYLDFHYRSQHPDLINFSNAAFYNSRLVPMPEKEDYIPIQLFQVNGMYNKDGINTTEAEAIVKYLFSEMEAEEGVFPSVGVATLNLHQRNYIWELIMEKSYESKETAQQLEALIDAGLFVKNLENIQGDERDYILMSTTFGPDKEGKFRQQIGPLAQTKGYQMLNVIITRAKKAIQIYTSIPEQVYMNFHDEVKEKGNTGKGIFYAYLAYAKTISETNITLRDNLINTIKLQDSERNVMNSSTSERFKDMLWVLLKNSLEPTYAVEKDAHFGGIVLDIAIYDAAHNLVLVLETEGKHGYFGHAAYRSALYKSGLLSKYEVPLLYMWSWYWLHEPQKQIEKIQVFLRQLAS